MVFIDYLDQSDSNYNNNNSNMSYLDEIGSSILLFFLVFGMSATVDIKQLQKQLNNRMALMIGVSLQFIILPFCGFLVVHLLKLPPAMGVTLLVVTSSPGGSYSNWWCSMFNAELALSVTMTAISTMLSTIMLPMNLVLYTRWTYSSDVVHSLDWKALFLSLLVVIGGISAGLITSAVSSKRCPSHRQALIHKKANLMGNFAGISLITLSIFVSSEGGSQDANLLEQPPCFYLGCALPAIVGLILAVSMATRCNLDKPERVAVSIESCYQNTGIATSVALNMFSGAGEKELATAIAVPLFYGMVEMSLLACFCLVCWKAGWTKAPPNESLCVMLTTSYEVEQEEGEAQEQVVCIEVVLGNADNDKVLKEQQQQGGELVFHQTKDGAYIVDRESLDKVRKGAEERGRRGTIDRTSSEEETVANSDGSDELVVARTVPSSSNSSPTKQRQRLPSESSTTVSSLGDDDHLTEEHSHTTDDCVPECRSTTTATTNTTATSAALTSSGTSSRMKERLERGMATVRARAEGYRRPSPNSPRGREDHISLSVLDEECNDVVTPTTTRRRTLSSTSQRHETEHDATEVIEAVVEETTGSPSQSILAARRRLQRYDPVPPPLPQFSAAEEADGDTNEQHQVVTRRRSRRYTPVPPPPACDPVPSPSSPTPAEGKTID